MILVILQRVLVGNITFEESTMTLTVQLLVCWARRTLYTLLKGYRETLGGGRWEVRGGLLGRQTLPGTSHLLTLTQSQDLSQSQSRGGLSVSNY